MCVANASLQWDEHNLQENQEDLDNTEARMVIDEPKTPFVHGASSPTMEEEGFDLDGDVPPPETTLSNTLANARTKARADELSDRLRAAEAAMAARPYPPVPPLDLESLDDEEVQAQQRHAAFDRKRHQHYGNEAAALKQAQALEEDEEM